MSFWIPFPFLSRSGAAALDLPSQPSISRECATLLYRSRTSTLSTFILSFHLSHTESLCCIIAPPVQIPWSWSAFSRSLHPFYQTSSSSTSEELSTMDTFIAVLIGSNETFAVWERQAAPQPDAQVLIVNLNRRNPEQCHGSHTYIRQFWWRNSAVQFGAFRTIYDCQDRTLGRPSEGKID